MNLLTERQWHWINPPTDVNITEGELTLNTLPHTDYWQRTYYGFRNDNAHTYLFEEIGDFTMTVKTHFDSKVLFDQCGVCLYQNSDNWFKASIEYEGGETAKLGSVVTNLGYSDWATQDIGTDIHEMWYRVSRRGQDFLIEQSPDGNLFVQMRILHMHAPIDKAAIGIYACSPLESSFTATFSHMTIGPCLWKGHGEA